MTQTTSGFSGSLPLDLHRPLTVDFWPDLAAEAEGVFGSCSFFASTTALTIEIAVTSAAGTAVQTISRPVLPCIGGPSSSSSGRARKLKTA